MPHNKNLKFLKSFSKARKVEIILTKCTGDDQTGGREANLESIISSMLRDDGVLDWYAGTA